MNSAKIDDLGRVSIISDLDKNLFVIAGAGSGKTSMLVSRMVMMVESGVDISNICAITFTKKAAAEFLDRFQNKLKERSKKPFKEGNKFPGDLPTPNEITALRCQKALESIDLCFTGTIDSFCNLVLSEYPNNAGIPSSSSVVDDDEFVELCKKEYHKLANDPNSPLKDKLEVFNLLFNNGPEVFAKSINQVMDLSHLEIKYPHPSKDINEVIKDLSRLYESEILSDLDILKHLKADVVEEEKYQTAYLEFIKAYNSLTQSWTIYNFKEIKKKIKKLIPGLRFKEQPSLMFFEFEYMSRGKCYKFKESDKYKDYLNKVDEITYIYSLDFLCSAASLIKQELKRQGKLSFNEYLVTFKDMVKRDMASGMKLINHIRKKHSYFLIDESQDTSPVQTELFIYLCSSNQANSIEECNPIPGSLFIVGDPKQSIYGFRGADVSSYLNTKRLFESVYDSNYHKVVYLTKNFRSTYELCSYFNSQFKDLDNFEEIPLEDKLLPPKEISNDVLSGLYSSSDYINAIKYLVGRKYIFDNRLYLKEESELKANPEAYKSKVRTYGKRLIEYKDIMLLTWSKTKHQDIISKLTDNNIPVYCEGKFLISSNDILSTIYAIYAYLAGEEGQLYNLLSSPLFRLSSNSLVNIKSVDDLPESKEKELLLEIESLRNIDHPISLYEAILRKLKLFDYVDFMNVEYALFTLEKLKEAYLSNEVSDISSASKFLKEFISLPLERCMNMLDTPNAVNLANVHKVKGLEKPIVILAESSFASGKKAVSDFSYQNQEAYIFRTSELNFGAQKIYEIDNGSLLAKEEEIANQKEVEENKRLGYVAVTRARNVLVIPPRVRNDGVWNYIRPESSLEEIPEIDYEEEINYASNFIYIDNEEFNLTQSYWEKRPSKEAKLTSKLGEEEVETPISEVDSRTKGTIVHRLLEMMINSKGKLEKASLINFILNEFSLSIDSEYQKILDRVYIKMISGGYLQKGKCPFDLLKLTKDYECYTEVPFAYKNGKEIWQGEIDLLLVKDDKYIIIDYKTNADDSNLEEEYELQLKAYKEALKKSKGVNAETYLYHIDA